MNNNFQSAKDLYTRVRAGFLLQGSSFNRWCEENGVLRQNAFSALTGSWNGPKAKKLREKIIKAANVEVEGVKDGRIDQ